MKRYMHMDTAAIAYNRRYTTNHPAIIVFGEDEHGQIVEDEQRVSAVIIKDKNGEEVARLVYAAQGEIEKDVVFAAKAPAAAWLETENEIELLIEPQKPDHGPGLKVEKKAGGKRVRNKPPKPKQGR